jgi:hypothetical protein
MADIDMMAAVKSVGIDPSTLDQGSDFIDQSQGTEAESEVENTEGETEEAAPDGEEGELESETVTPEGEEKTEGEAAAEKVEEEPKLTAKEFREIEAKRLELEAKEKAITDRFAAQEKEFQEKYHDKIRDFEQVDGFLGNVAETDPELYELIQERFGEYQKQFSHPVITQQKQKIEALEKKIDSFMNKASDEVTLTKLEADKNQLKATLVKDAESAGLKIDMKSLEDTWAKYPGMPLEEAFYAKYGAAYAKAIHSKAKVEQAEKKVASRPAVATAGAVKRSASPAKDNVPSDAFSAVRYFASKLGKA